MKIELSRTLNNPLTTKEGKIIKQHYYLSQVVMSLVAGVFMIASEVVALMLMIVVVSLLAVALMIAELSSVFVLLMCVKVVVAVLVVYSTREKDN